MRSAVTCSVLIHRAISLNPKLGDAWIYYYAMEYIQMHKKAMMLSNRIVDESQAESAQTAAGDSSVTEIAAAQDEDDDDDDLGDAFIISSSSSATNGTASSINGSVATSSGLSIWIWYSLYVFEL